MRINSVNRIFDAYNVQASAAVKKAEQAKSKDEVALSASAKDYSNIKKLLSDTPDVRTEKVEEIKARMASGNYNVSAEEVAEKMLSKFDIRG